MSEFYNPQEIEPKWQQRWEQDKLYKSVIDPDKPKFYALTMLPYPSGDIHIGHWYAMAPSDVRARFKRMQGYNVLFPMGFDAFGLPAENAAIQRGIHPKTWTLRNIERERKQLRSMGAMFDWGREAISCLPGYYKWTEWFFLKLYDMGLAYRKNSPVDYCPNCKTTLAREQVIGEERICERCGASVIKKDLEQWFWKITQYADELLDFSQIDWPEKIKILQTNWIGRSEGAEVVFKVAPEDMPKDAKPGEGDLVVFTTRPDTLWGATFMVLAPEHPLVERITKPDMWEVVQSYKHQAEHQTEIERLSTEKEKTGVFSGAYAINPVNGERIPIWVADYVMMTYGTGAIMAVPAHDERDFAFATKYGLPIPVVICPPDWDGEDLEEAYPGDGEMVNSGEFDGTPAPHPAVERVTAWLEEQGTGKAAVNYRLHDWLVSRQRYWGAPIPIIYCDTCGIVPVPYEDLPVLLPDDVDFMPTGESPLKYHEGFLNTTCPKCGGPATRETDTMDTFVCSSWYHYAYLSPYYKEGETVSPDSLPWDPEEGAYWLPVDVYTGGIEHATLHLLYTRFFTKALRDAGLVDFDEPMLQLRNQGIILGEPRDGDCVQVTGHWEGSAFRAEDIRVISYQHREAWPPPERSEGRVCGEVMDRDDVSLKVQTSADPENESALIVVLVDEEMPVVIPDREGHGTMGDILYHLEVEKMSKSKKNVVAPDVLVEAYGADVVRAYLMFGWRWELGGPWDSQGIEGVARWVNRVWNLVTEEPRERETPQPEAERALLRAQHYAIKSVTADMEAFSFNTAIARLMEYTNALNKAKAAYWGTEVWQEALDGLLLILAPVVPHLAEELWAKLGNSYSVHTQAWPTWDEAMLVEETVEIPVQINGKVRGRITVANDADEEAIQAAALEEPNVQRHLEGKQIVKIIVPQGRLVSIVVKG